MLKVEEIMPNVEIEYAAFLNDEGNFNLVSTIRDENTYNLLEGKTGFIRISSLGYLVELEILFVKPILANMDLVKPNKVVFGVPKISPYKSVINSMDPILIIKEKDCTAYILFGNSKISSINTIVECGAIRFLLNQMVIVGLEIPKIIKDSADEQQMFWLRERNML